MGCAQSQRSEDTSGFGDANSEGYVQGENQTFDIDWSQNGYLGEGSFAVVRRAKRKSDGKMIAVKICDRTKMNEEDRYALEVEIDVLSRLGKHPHIIELFATEKTDTHVFLYMDLISGGELFTRIVNKYENDQGDAYSEQDVGIIIHDLASALAFCHEHGVVHRDLKPENIMLKSPDNDNQVVLIDFGFAADLNRKAAETPCGTPHYVAPEILNGVRDYTPAVDVWSLGVIMYILLCGYPPFQAEDDNVAVLYGQIRSGDYSFETDGWEDISEGPKAVIRAMLTVDAKKRATMKQVVAMIAGSDFSSAGLTSQAKNLKKYLAKKRWKKGIQGVMATVKIKGMMKRLSEGKKGDGEGNRV